MKNKVVLYTGTGVNKKRVELYDFESIKSVFYNGRAYIRVKFSNTDFNLYPRSETTIAEVEELK